MATMERTARPRRARPRQRAVHRPRRRRVPDRGEPACVADGAVPVEGHGRADGRAGGPDRARRDARELGWAAGSPPPPFVAVKAPAFSTAKLQRRRPVGRARHAVDRRGHRHPRGPARRAGQGAHRARRCVPPRARGSRPQPLALLSIADRDKAASSELAAAPGRRGLPARGDARDPGALARRRVRGDPRREARRGAGSRGGRGGDPGAHRGGGVRLVVNTPTPRSGAVRDAAEIRHAAISRDPVPHRDRDGDRRGRGAGSAAPAAYRRGPRAPTRLGPGG